MVQNRRQIGNLYEAMAADYLKKQGYKILARQYRSKGGEIDLVAKDGSTIVFVEVKGRQTTRFGSPQEAVDRRKQRRIWRTAHHYLWSRAQMDALCRFDVIVIQSISPGEHRIEHIIGAIDGWA
ncbi:MAG: YraN family protein [Firmicutes bacterium]|jgi:putative endonuclease|nr:YraN family protein [Bacillota bacterium]